MRCGECQYWQQSDYYGEDIGSCYLFTSVMEGGKGADGMPGITPRVPYTGYDGWSATHRNFYCAGFLRVEGSPPERKSDASLNY